MRKVMDVLRLVYEAGRSQSEIARSRGISQSTISEYLARFRASGLSWPLPPDLDEAAVEARLFHRPALPATARVRPVPDWAHVHAERKRTGVTLQLLWMEYQQQYDGTVSKELYYQYTQFCALDHAWRARSANIDASAGAREEVERIIAQIRTAWPSVRITLRADSGFCRDALLTWCETHAVDYVIGLAKNTRLTALIADELTAAASMCTVTGAAARVFADLTYQTQDSWSQERRVVAKAEHLAAGDDGKSNPRFVVTSRPRTAIDAQTLYEELYCARGEMENRIKEQQLMLFADRTSAATMRANQLRLYCSSIAYLLLHALRRVALVGTALARPQCQTIRLTLLKVGARIRVTTRKVWLALASGCPHAALFARVHATLVALPRRC